MRDIPEGLIEVPVPAGVFIGSIESKFDTFSKVCIGETFAPTPESLTRITKAWEGFTTEERGLLGVDLMLSKLRRINLSGGLTCSNVAAKRRAIILEMVHRTGAVRAGLMSGRMRRPKHVNPRTMLVRA